MSATQELRNRRRTRLRFQLRVKSNGRPRLSVFRSGKNIYAQIIDDSQGRTLAAASSLDKDLREAIKTGADKAAAAAVGKLVAERALAAGVEQVPLDQDAQPLGVIAQHVAHAAVLGARRLLARPVGIVGRGGRRRGDFLQIDHRAVAQIAHGVLANDRARLAAMRAVTAEAFASHDRLVNGGQSFDGELVAIRAEVRARGAHYESVLFGVAKLMRDETTFRPLARELDAYSPRPFPAGMLLGALSLDTDEGRMMPAGSFEDPLGPGRSRPIKFGSTPREGRRSHRTPEFVGTAILGSYDEAAIKDEVAKLKAEGVGKPVI